MSTKNIVPRTGSDGGKIGTASKHWSEGHFDSITGSLLGDVVGNLVGNADTATSATDADTVDTKHATDFTLDYVTDNGNTTTNSIEVTNLTASAIRGQVGNLTISANTGPINLSASGYAVTSNANVWVTGEVSSSNGMRTTNLTASGHVSASAFYGDGQYLDNVGGNLQDVTDLGNTTTNSITTSGYHFGTSDGKIYDDDGEFRIRVLTTPGSPFEIRSGADVTYDNEIVCIMERPSDDERTNVLFGSGLNTLQAQRQLEVISRERLDSSYGVMFGTDEAAKFMNLEIRTAHDDSYSALDLTTNTAASSLQTSDYFGEADISGFRLRYMEDDLQFKIQSGNGGTVDDRLVIDRDTGEVTVGDVVSTQIGMGTPNAGGSGRYATELTDGSLLATERNLSLGSTWAGGAYTGTGIGLYEDTISFGGDVALSNNIMTMEGDTGNIQIFNQLYNSGEDKGAETADFAIDWNDGMTQEVILDSPGAATTLTASFDNVKPYATYQLIHKIGKDNMAIYFDESIYWPGGTRPTLSTTSGSIDVLTFTTDGNSPNPNIYGVAQYNFSASVG